MNRPLIVNPEAEVDLADAKLWYDGQREGLGDEFLSRVDDAFAIVRRSPELYAKAFEELRVTLVKRFPYAIAYRADDDRITVVAIYHTRSNPRGWQVRATH